MQPTYIRTFSRKHFPQYDSEAGNRYVSGGVQKYGTSNCKENSPEDVCRLSIVLIA
jgi:hypothetical protein